MRNVETDEKRSLWNRILGLLEEDLAQRRRARVFVRVRGESGIQLKEVGELSISERRSLDPDLREYAVEQLLDRYLAEQDLVKNRRRCVGQTAPSRTFFQLRWLLTLDTPVRP
jgi:hypothetical protein